MQPPSNPNNPNPMMPVFPNQGAQPNQLLQTTSNINMNPSNNNPAGMGMSMMRQMPNQGMQPKPAMIPITQPTIINNPNQPMNMSSVNQTANAMNMMGSSQPITTTSTTIGVIPSSNPHPQIMNHPSSTSASSLSNSNQIQQQRQQMALQLQEENEVITRQRLQELTNQVMPGGKLDPEVEEVILYHNHCYSF